MLCCKSLRPLTIGAVLMHKQTHECFLDVLAYLLRDARRQAGVALEGLRASSGYARQRLLPKDMHGHKLSMSCAS